MVAQLKAGDDEIHGQPPGKGQFLSFPITERKSPGEDFYLRSAAFPFLQILKKSGVPQCSWPVERVDR
jgi:hypothetical protein